MKTPNTAELHHHQHAVVGFQSRTFVDGYLKNHDQALVGAETHTMGGVQMLALHQRCNGMESQILDLKANIGEVREQASHRFASDIERLEDQTDTLFTAWSEKLQDELSQKQHRFNEHAQGSQLALEIRLHEVERFMTHRNSNDDSQHGISEDAIQASLLIVKTLPCGLQ